MSEKASDLNGSTQDECPGCPGWNLARPTKPYAYEQGTYQITDPPCPTRSTFYWAGMRALCEDCLVEGTRKGKKIVTYLLHAGIKTELGKFVLQCSDIVEDFYN